MKTPIITVLLTLFISACENSTHEKIRSVDSLKYIANLDVAKSDNIKEADTRRSESKDKVNTMPELSLDSEILISSGQTSPFTAIQINGCDFDLVNDKGDTIYLVTTDKDFQTPEGYKIGTKLFDLPKHVQKKLTKEPGWGYYFKLVSGWALGFCIGESCTDHYPNGNSKVKWIFKRR